MDTQSIMVQITDRGWTLAAMHFACALARQSGAEVALVKMAPVQHVGWLGNDLGYLRLTATDRQDMSDYTTITEDYAVRSSTHFFQYATLPDAILEAAVYLDAQTVFAILPRSVLPYWRRFQMWRLRRSLTRQRRVFYTLEQPDNAWPPSILVGPIEEKSRFSNHTVRPGLRIKQVGWLIRDKSKQ